MPATYTCDKCGKPARQTKDGAILCELHELEEELYYEIRYLQGQREWLRKTHFQHILNSRQEIAELKERIALLNRN